MDLTLTPAQLELQGRARAFVRDVLQPLEAGFERAGGRLTADERAHIREATVEAGLVGGSFPVELGGQGWTAIEQVLVHEQLGQGTGGLWSYMPGAYNALIHCDPDQRTRYLEPSMRGERFGSYAITEPGAGSDARALAATAERDGGTGEYVLNGEKWFVTGPPDETDFMIFHCLVVDGDERRPTLFLVDYDTPGVTMSHDPDYMHTFADRHPQFVLRDVRVAASAILGGVGQADELTNEWFVEERIHIGARCTGAMERLLTLAVEWATERIQFGERIFDFQGVSFPLADFGRRRLGRQAADPRGGLARGHRRRPQGGPCQGLAGQALRVRGGVPLRRSRGPGLWWPRLHARVRARAVLPRAAGRSHLGGHLGDPAIDHRPGLGKARRPAGGRVNRPGRT